MNVGFLEIYEENIQIFKLSLVSKQFFKVLSKQLMKNDSHSFPLLIPIESNNNNNFSLVYQSPLEFHYDSFKYIRYNTDKKVLDLIFSKIETFTIHSDQDDHIDREFGMRDITEYYDVNDDESPYYSKSTITNGYIIYPPRMPSLKSLVFYNYCGYSDNYSKLISHIFEINSKPSSTGYIGTIEHFYIKISDNYKSNKARITKVFRNLFKYHSNSLELIEIEFWEDESPKLVLELFEIFRSFGKDINDKVELRMSLLNNDISDIETFQRLYEKIESNNEEELLGELYSYIRNQKKIKDKNITHSALN